MSNVPRSLLSLDHTNAARSTQGATFTLSVIKEGDASATRCARPIRGGRTCDVVLSLLSCRSAKDCRPARWAHDGLNQHVVGSAWRLGGSRDRATAVRSALGRTDGGCLLHALSAETGPGSRAHVPSMAAGSARKRRKAFFSSLPCEFSSWGLHRAGRGVKLESFATSGRSVASKRLPRVRTTFEVPGR